MIVISVATTYKMNIIFCENYFKSAKLIVLTIPISEIPVRSHSSHDNIETGVDYMDDLLESSK